VMSAYNEVNDEPASASVYLLDHLLRQTFGFDGYVTSDCDSIYEIQAGHNWVPPGDAQPVDATSRHAWALTAGVDLDCNAGYSDGNSYGNRIADAIGRGITTETGLLTENDVDTALQRLFAARMQLGEFDEQLGLDVPWITAARERVPEGSWVNSNDNLAITQTAERLAMAREVAAESIVLLENDSDLLPLDVPPSGDFDVAVIGYFSNPTPSNSVVQFLGGYSSNQGSTAAANHVTPLQGISDAVTAANPDATVTYYKGFTNTGTNADQLTTIDPAAVAAAADADLAIVYVGSDASTANEQGDRADVSLPGAQAELLAQVGAANPDTIGVIEAIGMMDVRPFDDEISTLLWSSYNGQQKGAGLADVLMGDNNPSGHLPFTWYLGDEQLPDIRDYTLRPTDTYPGRTYRYFQGEVSFPFGYGLSYTSFDYSNIDVSDAAPSADDTVTVSVDVTNTGALLGEDIVELYATTPDAAPELERPVRRLVGFQKVALDPGETATVDFDVDIPDLAFFDPDSGVYEVDPGRYGFEASHAAGAVDEQVEVVVSGSLTPTLHHVSAKPNQTGDADGDIPNRVLRQERRGVPSADGVDVRRPALRLHRQGQEHTAARRHDRRVREQPTRRGVGRRRNDPHQRRRRRGDDHRHRHLRGCQ
jgi:beta-glucosidase